MKPYSFVDVSNIQHNYQPAAATTTAPLMLRELRRDTESTILLRL